MDKRSGLPHNLALEQVMASPEIFIYGDAFIFKLDAEPFGTSRARYLHWGEDFVMTGRGSVQWKDAVEGPYLDAKKKGRLEAEGFSTQNYNPVCYWL